MRQKIDSQAYQTVDDFAKDFELTMDNCMIYNTKDTIFHKAAARLKKQVIYNNSYDWCYYLTRLEAGCGRIKKVQSCGLHLRNVLKTCNDYSTT